MQTGKAIFRNIDAYAYMHAITFLKTENLKENKKGFMEVLGGKKGRGNDVNIIQYLKKWKEGKSISGDWHRRIKRHGFQAAYKWNKEKDTHYSMKC